LRSRICKTAGVAVLRCEGSGRGAVVPCPKVDQIRLGRILLAVVAIDPVLVWFSFGKLPVRRVAIGAFDVPCFSCDLADRASCVLMVVFLLLCVFADAGRPIGVAVAGDPWRCEFREDYGVY